LEALQEKGIDLEELTLHVGAGTFKPVKSEEIEGHEMLPNLLFWSKQSDMFPCRFPPYSGSDRVE